MKNIKYFLTLGIVIASSTVILTSCGKEENKDKANMESFMNEFWGNDNETRTTESAEKADKNCTKKIVTELKSCIDRYESFYATKSVPYVIPDNGGDIVIKWKKDDSCDVKSENEEFNEIVKSAFEGSYCESKVKKGSFAKATISLCDPKDRDLGYEIEVKLGKSINTLKTEDEPEEIDEKNAEKIVSLINSSISSYELEHFSILEGKYEEYLIPVGGNDIIIKWSGKDIVDNDIKNERLKEILENKHNDYDNYTFESKVKKGAYANATISLRDSKAPEYGYKIIVKLGNATANYPNY